MNDEEADTVTAELMGRAIDKSITRGHNVLYELLRRESRHQANGSIFRPFAKQGHNRRPTMKM